MNSSAQSHAIYFINPYLSSLNHSHQNQKTPWYNSFVRAFKSFRRRLERKYNRTHSLEDLNNLRSATNRYHSLITLAKKKFYSNLISTNNSNPRKLWKTINDLHRKSTKPLPTINQTSLTPLLTSSQTKSTKFDLKNITTEQTPSPHHISPTTTPAPLLVFTPTSDDEISKLLLSHQNKQCDLDPIPTSLLKQCTPLLTETITRIVNLSLSSGTFPSPFKTSIVTPVLKKSNLNKEDLNNYRPISNLSLLSKLTEKIVQNRLSSHLSDNSLFNTHQSAYTKHHSTETTLTYIFDKLLTAIGYKKVTGLCLLDLSAAFDTIAHKILLTRLSQWFGISGTAHHWLKSYLTSRSFHVSCLNQHSSPCTSDYGVPQGSVLGPLLFNLYTTPLSTLIKSLDLEHQLYADDTQLFLSFCPSTFSTAANNLESAFTKISAWMTSNLLALNPSKTEFLLIGLPSQFQKVDSPQRVLFSNITITILSPPHETSAFTSTHL